MFLAASVSISPLYSQEPVSGGVWTSVDTVHDGSPYFQNDSAGEDKRNIVDLLATGGCGSAKSIPAEALQYYAKPDGSPLLDLTFGKVRPEPMLVRFEILCRVSNWSGELWAYATDAPQDKSKWVKIFGKEDGPGAVKYMRTAKPFGLAHDSFFEPAGTYFYSQTHLAEDETEREHQTFAVFRQFSTVVYFGMEDLPLFRTAIAGEGNGDYEDFVVRAVLCYPDGRPVIWDHIPGR